MISFSIRRFIFFSAMEYCVKEGWPVLVCSLDWLAVFFCCSIFRVSVILGCFNDALLPSLTASEVLPPSLSFVFLLLLYLYQQPTSPTFILQFLFVVYQYQSPLSVYCIHSIFSQFLLVVSRSHSIIFECNLMDPVQSRAFAFPFMMYEVDRNMRKVFESLPPRHSRRSHAECLIVSCGGLSKLNRCVILSCIEVLSGCCPRCVSRPANLPKRSLFTNSLPSL